jgi:hypothetical protein
MLVLAASGAIALRRSCRSQLSHLVVPTKAGFPELNYIILTCNVSGDTKEKTRLEGASRVYEARN